MLFGLISVNYKNTPIEIREQAALSDTRKMELYEKLLDADIRQAVILSTCNRSELYVMVQDTHQIDVAQALFTGMFTADLQSYLYRVQGQEAVQVLFEVTAGLRSLVPGEDQILGQVKEAAEFSREMGCSGKQITKIFREAVTSTKYIKRELKISQYPLSLSYIGIQQLKEDCGISGKRALVIGSGKIAALAMTYLYEYGISHIWNCNRSSKRAQALTYKFPLLELCAYEKRYELLAQADIVVSATSSPHIVLQKACCEINTDAVYMLDLASPRDIDPAFHHVLNIDSLQKTAENHKGIRSKKIEEARRLLESDVEKLMKWLSSSRMDAVIQTLQERVDTVAEDTFCILDRKLDLTKREQYILKKTLYVSMQRLIREPVLRLKNVDEQEQAQVHHVMEELFLKEEQKGEKSCISD